MVHNHSLDLVNDVDAWIEAHIGVADKWDDRIPLAKPQNGDWKQRARRAEAEAAVARAQAVSFQLKYDAVGEENKRMKASTSWRMTKPLRWPKNLMARRRASRERVSLPALPRSPARKGCRAVRLRSSTIAICSRQESAPPLLRSCERRSAAPKALESMRVRRSSS